MVVIGCCMAPLGDGVEPSTPHGGTVEAESPGTGKGATFRVTLPLAGGHPIGVEDENRHTESTVIGTENRNSPTLQGIKVLVVEDAPDTREMIKRVLEDHQAEAMTAESASEALQVLEQSKPHVLIRDLGLPDEDGYELIESATYRNYTGGRPRSA